MDKKQKKPIGLVLLALILASIPVTLIPVPTTAQTYYTVYLTSQAKDGSWTNQGTVWVQGDENINFGTNVYKQASTYQIVCGWSGVIGGYRWSFDHWETSGGITVSNPYASSTFMTVSGDGTLKAVFFKWDFTLQSYPTSRSITAGDAAVYQITVSLVQTWTTNSGDMQISVALTPSGYPTVSTYNIGSPLSLKKSQPTATTYLTVYTSDNTTPGTYYMTVTGTISSTPTTHSIPINLIVNPPTVNKPDLIVIDFTWSPLNPKPGDQVTFTYTEKNQGNADAAAHQVTLFIDGNPISNDYPDTLPAGGTRTRTFPNKWVSTSGAHTARVKTDSNDGISESNEENNILDKTIGTKAQVSTSLTINLNPSSITPSTTTWITISGKLTRTDTGAGIADRPIDLEWTGGLTTVTTNSNGDYSYTTQVGPYSEGTYPFAASFAGYETTDTIFLSSESSTQLSVGKIATGLTVNVSPSTIYANTQTQITISGRLIRMDTGAGLGGKTIPLYYGWGSSDSVITDPNGYFSISKLVSLNQNNYVITANFLGDFIFSGSSVTTILHVSSPSYYTINFYTNPSNVGSIIFSGTTYTNGQSGSYASGSYVIVANVPSGYKFAGWTYSGGVSVSSPSSSSTTATVSGSGILTANFQSSTGNLQVTVKNANGNFISGATVKLYDSNWNWLNQDRITDSYGNAYWSNLNSGTYNIEVYYNPNVGLALTEFWGSNQVNVPSSGTANFVFTRHAPYISDIAFSASSINLGQSITAYVTITNPESFAVNCKARLILDRDYSSPYDYDSILGPQSIPSYGGTYTFNFIWTPSQEGTYYQYGVAYSYYNGTYIETDQWIWTQAFTVGAASDFSISANPNSLSFTKPSSGSTSKTSTITITSINNFNSQVSLSGSWIGTVPSGVTYSFSKNPVTPPSNGQDTSTLTITVSSAAGTGTFTLRISGTSGSLSHYVDISISISSQPTGSLQVSVNYPGGGSVTPETLILYDANWNEKSRISPSTNIYTFLDLTPGSYHVEAYYYDMWIGDALNIQVSSGQITSVTITTLRIQPLTITVYYSDGATPLFGANVTIYSHDSYYDRDNYRRAYATGINGKAYFYIWPTSKPSEYYKAYVHYAGKEIGSNTNVQVNKDNGSSISIITSLPFNGKRIPPEQISLIPQETDKSCWAASSKMILDFYGTYSGKSYSQIEIAQEMGSEYYYWNGLSVLLLKSWDWTLSRLGKLDADPDYGVVTESLTFDKVKSDIELNRPIIAFYAGDLWIIPNLLPYHAVVIVGYIDEDGELNDKVIVYDPWPPNKGEAQTRLWKDVKEELWTICNGFRTEPQVLEGTTLTLYESGHKLYLHVYDSQGRHVGMDHESGQIEIGIPNAKYTDFDFGIAIVLPSSIIDFNYVIDATRSENTTESYKIVTTTLRQGMIILEDAKSGIIEQGEKQDYNFQISQEPWWIVYQSWLIVGIPSMIIVVAAIFLISKKRDKKVKTLPRLSDKKRNRKVKHLVLPHLRIFWSRIP